MQIFILSERLLPAGNRALSGSVEQVSIGCVTVQDVSCIFRIIVISFVKMVIARDVNNLHVCCHERLTGRSRKTNIKVELLALPCFFGIVKQKVVG